jgi:hypothetical protein
VARGSDGVADFERIRYRHNDESVFLYAFDLIELDGDDLRDVPLTVCKRLRGRCQACGSTVFRHAGIISLNEHKPIANPRSWLFG